MTIRIIIVLCSITLAVMRLYGTKDPAFQAAAHLFVGIAGLLRTSKRIGPVAF
jgi:hypothetical protein